MIVELINVKGEYITYEPITFDNSSSWNDFNIGEPIDKLNDILLLLDCSVIFNAHRNMMTTYPRYNKLIREFIYCVLKLDNYLLYNVYIDKLIDINNKNITFELNNPIINNTNVKPKKIKSTKTQNKYFKETTRDLFTEEIVYIYTNYKTKDVIKSNNPNLLEELNNKPKKQKAIKNKEISFSSVKFNFNKK